MTTIRYVLDNPDLTDAGYAFSEEMSRFADEAAEADYSADDGENFQLAVDEFWEMANGRPRRLYERLGVDRCAAVREMVLTLLNPKAFLDGWRRDDLREGLARSLTREELADAFDTWGRAANEYFRLRWLVAEHGGWRRG